MARQVVRPNVSRRLAHRAARRPTRRRTHLQAQVQDLQVDPEPPRLPRQEKPAIKAALKRKSPGEQVAWFKDQKKKRLAEGRHANYNFEELLWSETQSKTTGAEARERVHWKPFAVWYDQEMKRAEVKGEIDPKDSAGVEVFREEMKEEWERLLSEPTTLAKKINDVWHVLIGR